MFMAVETLHICTIQNIMHVYYVFPSMKGDILFYPHILPLPPQIEPCPEHNLFVYWPTSMILGTYMYMH